MYTVSTSKRKTAGHGDRYHHGNLREALLAEGMNLLEEAGESGFSLRELARRVGVTANAVYRHFANKEALLMGLAVQGFELFSANQMRTWQQTEGDVDERFLATGGSYVRFARQHPALFRLMFGRFAAEHRSAELDAASQTAFATLQQGVAVAVGLPAESRSAMLAAYSAWAVVHGFSHLILDGQMDDETEELEAVVEASLRQWVSARRQAR